MCPPIQSFVDDVSENYNFPPLQVPAALNLRDVSSTVTRH
jgi:hypothetical protein